MTPGHNEHEQSDDRNEELSKMSPSSYQFLLTTRPDHTNCHVWHAAIFEVNTFAQHITPRHQLHRPITLHEPSTHALEHQFALEHTACHKPQGQGCKNARGVGWGLNGGRDTTETIAWVPCERRQGVAGTAARTSRSRRAARTTSWPSPSQRV